MIEYIIVLFLVALSAEALEFDNDAKGGYVLFLVICGIFSAIVCNEIAPDYARTALLAAPAAISIIVCLLCAYEKRSKKNV